MAEGSKIEWCDHTFNPWIGCQKVSPGCDNCYAETQNAHRKWNGGTWGPHAPRKRTSEANWRKPRQWASSVRAVRYPRQRVFCASLADVLDNKVPQEWRNDLWQLIRETPELDWLILTKRPENFADMLPDDWGDGYPNVWLGVTAEDQERADHRIPILIATPAAVRFVSYEPALGPLDLWSPRYRNGIGSGSAFAWGQGVNWVIAGGESGANRREADPAWFRAVRDECAAAGCAFFMKQMTGKSPIPVDLLIRQFPVVGYAGEEAVSC